jgi:hypothetical protein
VINILQKPPSFTPQHLQEEAFLVGGGGEGGMGLFRESYGGENPKCSQQKLAEA